MAAQKANTKKTGSWDLPLKVIKTGIVSWLIVFRRNGNDFHSGHRKQNSNCYT